jgi:hypothetical protein
VPDIYDYYKSNGMSRFEMPLGDGALAVAYYKVENDGLSCSIRRCRKSRPAWSMDRGWRMAFSKRCDATGKE